MEKFLAEARQKLGRFQDFRKVHVVLGNEACDLDSGVSALVYGFLLSYLNGGESAVTVLPVLNIPREDFMLRTEIVFCFKENNISSNLLIFRDQIDLHSLHSHGKLQLTLVDHNVLNISDSSLEPAVVEVIDHHRKERKDGSCAVTVETVGSCCTLVAEKLLNKYPNCSDKVVFKLLYDAIILDTVCLSEKAKKVTPKDIQIIRELEKRLPGVTMEEVFESLASAKMNVSGLTPLQLLRKDLKVICNATMTIAVASLPLLLQNYAKHEDAISNIQLFCSSNSYHILVLMGSQVDAATQDLQREIAVYSSLQVYREQVVDVLESSEEPPLFLEPLKLGLLDVTGFKQGNTAASRKQVIPLLKMFLVGEQSSAGSKSPLIPPSPKEKNVPFADNSPMSQERASSQEEPYSNSLQPMNWDISPMPVHIPNGLSPNVASQAAQYLGVGDPFSQGGSSQSSSTQNSCPYTPQNSNADDGVIAETYMLPSFNSRDMMEKIESKRGKLRGYVAADEDRHYPFTPKNSFVESSFDAAYQKMNPTPLEFDTEVIMQKYFEKKQRINTDTSDETEEATGTTKHVISVTDADSSPIYQQEMEITFGGCSPDPMDTLDVNDAVCADLSDRGSAFDTNRVSISEEEQVTAPSSSRVG